MNNSGFRSAREQIIYLFVFIMFILITVFVNRNSTYRISYEFIPLDSGWTLDPVKMSLLNICHINQGLNNKK